MWSYLYFMLSLLFDKHKQKCSEISDSDRPFFYHSRLCFLCHFQYLVFLLLHGTARTRARAMQHIYVFSPVLVPGLVGSQGTNDMISCVSIFRSLGTPPCFADLIVQWQYELALYPRSKDGSPFLSSLPGFPFPPFTSSQVLSWHWSLIWVPSPESYLKRSLPCPSSSLLRFGADMNMLVRAMSSIWYHWHLYIICLRLHETYLCRAKINNVS